MKQRRQSPQNFEYSAVILLTSAIVVKIIGAVFKIPLKHLIGTLGFGYFSSAYDLFLPIYALSMAGLPVAVSRLVAENMASSHYKEAHQMLHLSRKAFLTTGLTGLTVILLAIYPFAKVTTSNATDAGYIAVCVLAVAPAILFCCLMSAYRGYYEGMRNMYPTAVSDIIEALGKLILGYGLAYLILKLTGNVAFAAAGALGGIMIGTIAGTLYLVIRHKRVGDPITPAMLEQSPPSRPDRVIVKALIAMAVPVVLSSLANNITLLIDTTMVKWQLKNVMLSSYEYISQLYANSIADYNSTAKEALTAATMPTFLYGIRGEAYAIYNIIPTLTTTLGIGAIPILTTYWVQHDKNNVKKSIDKILRLIAIIAIPAGIGIVSISPYLMKLLYGDVASVEIGSTLLATLGIASVFSSISVPINSMLQAIGKPMTPVKNIAVGATLKILVNFLLVGRPALNIKGVPVGTAVCYLYLLIANMVCLIRYTGVMPDFKSTMLKPFIASLCSGVAAYFVSAYLNARQFGTLMIVAISVVVAVLVYAGLIFALRTLTVEDVEEFPMGKKLAHIMLKLHLIR